VNKVSINPIIQFKNHLVTHSTRDNIKMDLKTIGRGGMDSIDLAQDRDPWRALMNKVHKMLGNC
jgi:hypothetical protein